ncbi:MAG: cobalamin synthesis protein [Ramlibacter sp.]|nr:cobalamin synthesis protein [Ramlibacter sp.]
MVQRVPVTVLTGYLGAGKTTLLNRILREDHGRRYAVIVNEFGEIGIDGDLIMSTDEELFEMNNGCVCCTVRGDLIRTLQGLLQKGGSDARPFDAIIVETTGLADPGPVAQTFFMDPLLHAATVLDSITTLVDARHIGLRLDDSREAVEQIAFADQIVLNKTELVDARELDAVEARLRRINPMAPIHRTQRAGVPLESILGRGGFDLARIESLEPGFLADTGQQAQPHVHDEHCGHDHECHDHHANSDGAPRALVADHFHDDGIASVCLSSHHTMDREAVSRWLQALVASQGTQILRLKGIFDVQGEPRKLVVQGVHMLLEGDLQRPWTPQEPRTSRLVLIGRGLDRAVLQSAFEACAASA